jgi:Zn-dependent M28 family amino/carboxypeptidase
LLLLFLFPVLWTVQPLLRHPRPGVVPRVDAAQLEVDVHHLVEAFEGRGDHRPEVLAATAAWIEASFRASGGRTRLQSYAVNGRSYLNVRARYGPEAGPRLVVGAHYDACAGLPGADDNASGVAGLLALGRLLGAQPPSGSVELVAYTLEEPPHFRKSTMGSAQHVAALRAEGVEVRAMLCLEMLGTFSDEPGSQHYPLPGLGLVYPDRGDFITVVGDLASPRLVRRVKGAMQSATELPVWSINAPAAIPGIDFSDHRNDWAAGLPAVMITDTAFFRNPRYHTATDTPDRLDYRRMAQVVQGIHAAVRELTQ